MFEKPRIRLDLDRLKLLLGLLQGALIKDIERHGGDTMFSRIHSQRQVLPTMGLNFSLFHSELEWNVAVHVPAALGGV